MNGSEDGFEAYRLIPILLVIYGTLHFIFRRKAKQDYLKELALES